MTYVLEIRSGASEDIEEAYGWYEDQSEGLGRAFLSKVRRCIEAVQSYPLSYAIVHRNARRATLHKFPYGLYFSLYGDTIVIFSCYHSSRDPEGWKNRL